MYYGRHVHAFCPKNFAHVLETRYSHLQTMLNIQYAEFPTSILEPTWLSFPYLSQSAAAEEVLEILNKQADLKLFDRQYVNVKFRCIKAYSSTLC
jgi:hypothetical protein